MMKNLKQFSITSVLSLVLLLFVSCDDDSEIFTASQPTAPVLADLNFASIELDAVNTNNPALTLNWQHADYSVQTAINYAIQIANDQNFTNPVTAVTITGQTSITLSVSELNSAAGNAGLNPFEWATIYIRVVSSLGTQNSLESASNTVNLMVYPYFNYVFDDYYLVGNATAPDWNNNGNNPPLFRDPNDPNSYTYIGFFNKGGGGTGDGRFKVIETKGLWQPQWGTTYPDGSDPIETSGDIAGNPGTQSADPGRFGVTASGNHTFTINFATLEYSIATYTTPAVLSTATLTLQGSAVSGGATAMNQLGFDTNIFYLNSVRLVPGQVEFLTDSSAIWGGTTAFSGTATDGGGSINVPVEDDYDVWFNALTGQYILIPLNL